MMIFNFIKYTQWPEDESRNDFIIGIVGNPDIYSSMTLSYGGKIFKGNRTIVVKLFKNASEIPDCDVIFVDNSKSKEFDAIREKVKGKETLVITDQRGLGSRGSCINFRTVDGKLRYEINQKALESARLRLSNSLTSMAILI